MMSSSSSSSASSAGFCFQKPKGPTTLSEMLKDTRYNQGRALINNGQFDAAIEHFEDLLKTT
jgi:hypothetical protein